MTIGLVALVGVRDAIGLSVIPGLLAAFAIVYAIRSTAAPPGSGPASPSVSGSALYCGGASGSS
jgi:hypothetical protein